jgi:hypothetical protein
MFEFNKKRLVWEEEWGKGKGCAVHGWVELFCDTRIMFTQQSMINEQCGRRNVAIVNR